MPDVLARLDAALGWLRARIGRRTAVRFASLAAWGGAVLGLVLLLAWQQRWLDLPHPALLLAPTLVFTALGFVAGSLRPTPDRRELALLLDSLLDSDEAATAAVEMHERGLLDDTDVRDSRAAGVVARLDAALVPPSTLADRLPVRPARHLRLLPLLLVATLLGLLLPRAVRAPTPRTPGDLAEEAERLEERRKQIEEEHDVELPDELDAAFDEVVAAMKDQDEATASKKADELREKLEEFAQEQQEQAGDAAAAAEAMEQVDQELAEDLQDAARDGDLSAAADAVESLRERLGQQGQGAQETAARELERAAEQAAQAGRDELSDALREEARRAREQAEKGSQGQQGQQGSQSQQGQQGSQTQQGQQGQGQQGQQGSDGLAEYLRQLDQQGVGGDALAEAQRQMEAAQELNGALGGSSDRIGQQQGQGGGQGAGQQPSWGAGTSHTDRATEGFSLDGAAHRDMDRQVDGSYSDWTVTEHSDYDEQRLEGVNALTQSVKVPLNDGPIETLSRRKQDGSETSLTPLSVAPESYRRAAEEAVGGESVPRAYRDQVKQYFDLESPPKESP